jgi:hypothetical protein
MSTHDFSAHTLVQNMVFLCVTCGRRFGTASAVREPHFFCLTSSQLENTIQKVTKALTEEENLTSKDADMEEVEVEEVEVITEEMLTRQWLTADDDKDDDEVMLLTQEVITETVITEARTRKSVVSHSGSRRQHKKSKHHTKPEDQVADVMLHVFVTMHDWTYGSNR